jgi:hypothetical protein
MADYEIGYRKPPKSGRFRPGVSGNPSGRPKRRPTPLAEIIANAINAPIEYQEGGQTKITTFRELSLKTLVDRAVGGDVDAAELALKILAHAEAYGDSPAEVILVDNWLADYAGQTAEGKTRDFANSRVAESAEWRRPSDG